MKLAQDVLKLPGVISDREEENYGAGFCRE